MENCRRQRKEAEKRVKEAEQRAKETEKLAESLGIRLFHSLTKSKEYNEAEKLYQEIKKERTPTENEDILALSHSFAAMLVGQKRFQDAEPISRAVWEKRKEGPGPPSEVSKESHRQLCSILCALGKHKEAEDMQRNVYETGTMDAWTLENGDEVCQRLQEQGKIEDAKEVQDKVWKKRRSQNGRRDGLTIRSGLRLIELLEQLVATVDNQDGKDVERRLHTTNKQLFGIQIEFVLQKIWDTRSQLELTEDVLNAGHKLGVVLFNRNEFLDAEAIFDSVWEGKKRSLGDRNPSTISTGSMLCRTLCSQRELEKTHRAVVILPDIWQTRTTSRDAEAIASGEDLAQAYHSIGDWPNAERCYAWIWQEKMRKRYPAPEIEDTRWLLAQTLYKQGASKKTDALRVLRELYQKWNASSLDPNKTLECGYMLAQLLSQDKKVEEAQEIAQDVFNRRSASEERGVAYLDSGYLYGSSLLDSGRFADAERVLVSIQEHQVEGTEGRAMRLRCGHLLGKILDKEKKFSEAKKVLETVVDTQAADSAEFLELEEARKLLREVVNRQKKAKEKIKRNSVRRGGIFSKWP